MKYLIMFLATAVINILAYIISDSFSGGWIGGAISCALNVYIMQNYSSLKPKQ